MDGVVPVDNRPLLRHGDGARQASTHLGDGRELLRRFDFVLPAEPLQLALDVAAGAVHIG